MCVFVRVYVVRVPSSRENRHLLSVCVCVYVSALVFRAQDVSCAVGKKQIIQDVSGKASAGKLLAVMGPSGSGKTTLLNALANQVAVSENLRTAMGYLINSVVLHLIAPYCIFSNDCWRSLTSGKHSSVVAGGYAYPLSTKGSYFLPPTCTAV